MSFVLQVVAEKFLQVFVYDGESSCISFLVSSHLIGSRPITEIDSFLQATPWNYQVASSIGAQWLKNFFVRNTRMTHFFYNFWFSFAFHFVLVPCPWHWFFKPVATVWVWAWSSRRLVPYHCPEGEWWKRSSLLLLHVQAQMLTHSLSMFFCQWHHADWYLLAGVVNEYFLQKCLEIDMSGGLTRLLCCVMSYSTQGDVHFDPYVEGHKAITFIRTTFSRWDTSGLLDIFSPDIMHAIDTLVNVAANERVNR